MVVQRRDNKKSGLFQTSGQPAATGEKVYGEEVKCLARAWKGGTRSHASLV